VVRANRAKDGQRKSSVSEAFAGRATRRTGPTAVFSPPPGVNSRRFNRRRLAPGSHHRGSARHALHVSCWVSLCIPPAGPRNARAHPANACMHGSICACRPQDMLPHACGLACFFAAFDRGQRTHACIDCTASSTPHRLTHSIASPPMPHNRYLRSGSASSEDVSRALLSGSSIDTASPTATDAPATTTTAETPDSWAAVEFEQFMCSISRAQLSRGSSSSSCSSSSSSSTPSKRRERSDSMSSSVTSGSWSPPADSERDSHPAFAVRVCLVGKGKRIRID
jgi:hypothetical protein